MPIWNRLIVLKLRTLTFCLKHLVSAHSIIITTKGRITLKFIRLQLFANQRLSMFWCCVLSWLLAIRSYEFQFKELLFFKLSAAYRVRVCWNIIRHAPGRRPQERLRPHFKKDPTFYVTDMKEILDMVFTGLAELLN